MTFVMVPAGMQFLPDRRRVTLQRPVAVVEESSNFRKSLATAAAPWYIAFT